MPQTPNVGNAPPPPSGSRFGFGQVPAFPLAEILRAVNRSSVDYWSLDTEGSEGAILEATDFRSLEAGRWGGGFGGSGVPS